MHKAVFLELAIVRRENLYFVMVIDDIQMSEAGPFQSKREAQAIYNELARKAKQLTGNIKKEVITEPQCKVA